MKTSWSSKYLENKHGVAGARNWAQQKARAYNDLHEVTFNIWTSHDEYHIYPVVDFSKPMILDGYDSQYEREMMDDICSYISAFGTSMLRLHELTGWSLKDVEKTMIFLIKCQGYLPVVNRMGTCSGIKQRFTDF